MTTTERLAEMKKLLEEVYELASNTEDETDQCTDAEHRDIQLMKIRDAIEAVLPDVARKSEKPPFEETSSMVFLNGKDKPSFRCSCGANVFTKYAPNKYRCNGCGECYVGE